MTNIIQKIIDNKHKIVGIEIDGNFYNVDYVSIHDTDCHDQLVANDITLYCYITDTSTNVTENYYFDTEDIKNAKEIKLYELKEIENG